MNNVFFSCCRELLYYMSFFFFCKPFCNSPTHPHLHETIFQVSFLVGVFWSFKVYTSFFLLFFCSLVSSLYFLFLFWHCIFFAQPLCYHILFKNF